MRDDSSMIGRRITRVETDGRDQVLIHLDNGTALEITGSSYEEVSQHVELLDRAAVNAHQRRLQGEREQKRLRRLKDQERRSLTCEQRAERNRLADERRGSFAMMVNRELAGAIEDMMLDSIRFSDGLFGRASTYQPRAQCPACGERWCENAPLLKSLDRGLVHYGGTMTIPVKNADA